MYSMIRRLIVLVATIAVVTAVSGCVESSLPQATGEGNIRGINSIVTSPDVFFLIEERSLGEVAFKETSGFSPFDDLSYLFNFDVLLPGTINPTRLTSQLVDVIADHEYTVILTGTIANPSSIVWEDTAREWAGTETVFEIFFAHLAPSLGEVDVYFAMPGTVPVLGQAVGSLTSGDRLPVMEFEEAQYELILTPKDDPATILYQSLPIVLGSQTRSTFAIFDIDPSVTGNVAVSFIGQAGASSVVGDVNFPPQVRTLHAAFGTENFDGYFDNDFTNVVFPDIAFQGLSQYAAVVTSTTPLTLTPVGNSGAVIHEGDVITQAGSRRTIVLAGVPGSLGFLALLDEARPLETFPVVRITNTALSTEFLDVYMLAPGTPIDDLVFPQLFGIPPLANSGFAASTAGMLEITVTVTGEKTPISAPVILNLSDGDVIDIAIYDTVDPGMVELIVFASLAAP